MPHDPENVTSFPKSFFAERYFQSLIRDIRQPGSGAASWLADALRLLVEHVECFPPPDDEDAYVVEYIYPH